MTLPIRPAKPTTRQGLDDFLNRPPDLAGDGIRAGDRPVEGVQKYARRRLMRRLVQDGERTYHAYSADELIEIDSLAHHGRPGMPY